MRTPNQNTSPSRARFVARHIFGSIVILVVAAVFGSCFLIPYERGGSPGDLWGTCGMLYVVGAIVGASAWLGIHLANWEDARKPAGSYVALTPITAPPAHKKNLDPAAWSIEPAFHVEGRGTQATDPVELAPGMYRLRYDLPPRAPTTVRALGLVSRAEITILDAQNGAGSITFDVEEPDRYVFQVEIQAKTAREWTFDCERI